MSSKKENLRIKSIKSKSSSLKTDNTLKKNLELNSFDSKNNQVQVTLSQKQTIASSDYENYSRKSSKKTEETKFKCTTYELLELVDFPKKRYSHSEIKYKVKCIKCGWIGITTYRSIIRSIDKENKKCSHIGGYTIHPGDKFGKYVVIKKILEKR